MNIGYARVSTRDQNLELQLDALAKAGCEQVFQEEASGASMDRPVLAQALSHLRPGDTLVFWKLDRLGRTTGGLVKLADDLRGRGVHLHSLTDGFDTSTPAGELFYTIIAGMAQMERSLMRERTRAGLAAARERGRLGGRRNKISEAQAEAGRHLIAAGKSIRQAADMLDVSKSGLQCKLARNPASV